MFKTNDYIVTLQLIPRFKGNCGKENYCFKQREDSNHIQPSMDLSGSDRNGHAILTFDKSGDLKDWRYATAQEIAEYDRINKPYDVTTLPKDQIISNYDIW